MEIETIQEIKKEFYDIATLKKILYEVYFPDKNLYREFSLLNYVKKNNDLVSIRKQAFRGITFTNLYFLEKTLNHLTFFNDDSNIFSSVARLKQLPNFSFKNRTAETKPFYEKEFLKYIIHYDLFIDLDLKDDLTINDLLDDLKKLTNLIINYRLNSEIVFSGSRGFKILLYNDVYNFKTLNKIYYNLIKYLNLKCLDTANFSIPSRLMKVNFSIAFKNDSVKFVMPLNIWNFQNILERFKEFGFKIFDYSINNSFYYYMKADSYKSLFLLEYQNENNLKQMVKELKLLRSDKK